MELDNQQVMGPHGNHTTESIVPKFKYDGGNPLMFLRDFPIVATEFGVNEVNLWDEDKELDEEKLRKNNKALLILRQYITERILSVITVGRPTWASTVYRNLREMFLSSDTRTKVQIQRELHLQNGDGKSLVDFLARINTLIEEQERLGELMTKEVRMVTIVSRLREPWRQIANDKMDRTQTSHTLH